MEATENPAALGARTGLDTSCLAADDNAPKSPKVQPEIRNPVAVAAAIKDLTIDWSVEAAHIASIAARHFVEDMEIGDLWAAEHNLAVAVTQTIIESKGVSHRIGFSIDHIRREPRIDHVQEPGLINSGTRITVICQDLPWSIIDAARSRFLQVAQDYTWVNPHLTLTVRWDRPLVDKYHERDDDLIERPIEWSIAATDQSWRKWLPSDPTSPHWYDAERLGRLIGANIAHAEDNGSQCPTVLAFIREFRGLSSTARAKAICDSVGAARQSLSDFYGDGTASEKVELLLDAMRKASRPIKPKDLGPIGKDHLAKKFEAAGADLESFDYRRAEFEHEGLPYLAEFAFGFCPDGADVRRIVTGVNWGVSIGSDPFRRLGPGGEGLSGILTEQRLGRGEPIVTVLHLSCPRIAYLDRGKSSILIPGSRSW